jgi:hypothetical protein
MVATGTPLAWLSSEMRMDGTSRDWIVVLSILGESHYPT